jgi:D-glycero-beta-D-manno-heptose-7-phosphate kinase
MITGWMQHGPTEDPEPIAHLADQLAGKCVLILGDVILDEYVEGEVKRISPEAPVPVVEFRSRSYIPGGAANVAANVVSAGGRALLAGVVGHDPQAERLAAALRERDIQARLFADHNRPSTTKTRILAHNQQIVRLDQEERAPIGPELEEALLDWVEQHLDQADACVLSDYGKGVVTTRLAREYISRARGRGLPVIADPKNTDYTLFRDATVIKPNLHEAARFVQRDLQDDSSFLEAGRQLAGLLAGTALLITRGPLGMSLFRHTSEPIHTSAVARNVFDVTGAGDTVIALLALALGAGIALELAVELANRGAGIVVEKLGTATVTLTELKARQR